MHRIPAYGYVFTEPTKKGKHGTNSDEKDEKDERFDKIRLIKIVFFLFLLLMADKAMKLGAKGPQLGQLKSGQDVTLENGIVIKSEDCLMSANPGRKIGILQDTKDSKLAYPYLKDCDLLVHEATYQEDLKEQGL